MCVKNITLTKMPYIFCVAISTKILNLKDFFCKCVLKKLTPTKLPECMYCVAISTPIFNLWKFV